MSGRNDGHSMMHREPDNFGGAAWTVWPVPERFERPCRCGGGRSGPACTPLRCTKTRRHGHQASTTRRAALSETNFTEVGQNCVFQLLQLFDLLCTIFACMQRSRMGSDEGAAMDQASGSWAHEAGLPAGLVEAVAWALFEAAEQAPGARIPAIAAEDLARAAIEAVQQAGCLRSDTAPKGA